MIRKYYALEGCLEVDERYVEEEGITCLKQGIPQVEWDKNVIT